MKQFLLGSLFVFALVAAVVFCVKAHANMQARLNPPPMKTITIDVPVFENYRIHHWIQRDVRIPADAKFWVTDNGVVYVLDKENGPWPNRCLGEYR
jgi:hypothetical protein